jgi:hypothetical protein
LLTEPDLLQLMRDRLDMPVHQQPCRRLQNEKAKLNKSNQIIARGRNESIDNGWVSA